MHNCLFFTCTFLIPRLVVWLESGFEPVKLISKSVDTNRQAVGTILSHNDLTGLWTRTDLSGKIMMTDSQIQKCNCSCLGN